MYPIMYKIKGMRVTVIGAGEVALRKVKDLTDAGADITVIAPDIHPDLLRFADAHKTITIKQRPYQNGDCEGAVLIFSTASNTAVNHEVFKEASRLNIPINAADDPDNSSFYVPSFFMRGPLIVAVSTGGASPALAAKLRRHLEEAVPPDVEATLEALAVVRNILREDYRNLHASQRGNILKAIVNDEKLLAELLHSFKSDRLNQFIEEAIKKNNA